MSISQTLSAAAREFSATEHLALATLRFSGKEFFFDGHFPGDPVLPAFVQVEAALWLASRTLKRALALREITRAVFKSPTGPGRDLHFEIALSEVESGLLRLKCAVTEGAASIAEFTLRVE